MMKNGKKLFSLAFTVIFLFVCCASVFGAEIRWDSSDLAAERTILSENFDPITQSLNRWGAGSVDSETFKETAHNNVYKIEGNYAALTSGEVRNYIDLHKKVRIKFDYYSDEAGTLHVQLRAMAKNASGGELSVGAKNYWSGSVTETGIIGNSEWQTFDGVFDVSAYVEALKASPNFGSIDFGGSYLYLRNSNSQNNRLYIDNLEISTEVYPLPLNEPTVIQQSGWESVIDAEGHKDIYKAVVTVDKAGKSVYTFKGAAPGYFVDGSEYNISFSFKEVSDKTVPVTRMWRFYNKATNSGAENVKVDVGWSKNGYIYHDGNATAALNDWNTVSQNFIVGENDGTSGLKDGNFSIYWESRVAGGDKVNYDESMNGDYTLYIADFKITRVPGASLNSSTVAFDEEQTISHGGALKIPVEGYLDDSVAPKIIINDETVEGKWADVSKSGKYVNATAVFESVTSAAYPNDSYSATLSVNDIWNIARLNAVNISLQKNHTDKVEVLTGDWESLSIGQGDTVTITENEWLNLEEKGKIGNLMAEGKALIRYSFDVKGENGAEYSSSLKADFRMGNNVDIEIEISKDDLNSGEVHHYSKIADIGALDRYYAMSGKVYDRTTESYNVYLRGAGEDKPIYFTNIKVEYFNPDAQNKAYVAARLSITNNDLENRYSPSGTLIFAKYSGKQLTDIDFRGISYKDLTSGDLELNNALGANETKYVYLTGVSNGGLIGIGEYSAANTYKALYWGDIKTMNPLADAAVK